VQRGEALLSTGAELLGIDFRVDKRLARATLRGSVEACRAFDDEGNCLSTVELVIDLSWTATGGLVRTRDTSSLRSPGCRVRSSFQGSARAAQASGTVSDGETNFTPEPSEDGRLGLGKSRFVSKGPGC
jgi:hypothetical protein